MKKVYDEIWRPHNGTPADLPAYCPVCQATTVQREGVNTPWESRHYACGGAYKSKPQIQNHTNKWWGHCGKGQAKDEE